MDHACHCHTGRRTLALIAPEIRTGYPELETFCAPDAGGLAAEDAAFFPVSGCGQFTSVTEVVNFLRTVLDTSRLAGLRGAWLPGSGPATTIEQLRRDAKPVESLTETDSSPLLKILTERRIETAFQPIFRAKSLDLWGYECLMRARDEAGKNLSPAQIIQWARQEQLVFMLDRVCRETHLINAGKAGVPNDATLLINFMPTSIYKPEFCLQTTMAAAQRSNLAPERVIFEVVESEEVIDRDHLSNILNYYRSHGFRVALDDLGAGYAGLSLLADLNPDLLKIDRELINKAVTSPMHRAVCESLVRIGRDTGKLVLAEGVETAAEAEMMTRAGVDLFQGYYFGKPNAVPATEPLRHQTRMAA